MNKLKKYILNRYFIVLCLIIIISVTLLIIVGTNNTKGYIILSNSNVIECSKKKGCKLENTDKITDKDIGVLDVYNDTYLGKYKLSFNPKLNFFDLNGNWTNILDGYIAASNDLNLKLKDYTARDLNIDELASLNTILSKEGIYSYTELEQLVVEYNFNQNNKLEKIIIVSNATIDSKDETLFSIVIGYIKNKYEVLEFNKVSNDKFYQLPAYRLKGIINILDSKNDLVLIIKGYYSEEREPSTLLYEANKSHFKNILSN